MPLRLITAPTEEPVTLAETKASLRVTTSDDDALLASLVTAAREQLDGPEGLCGALLTQTWELLLDAFPSGAIAMPLAPLQSVTSVQYLDTAGVQQTLAASVYVVDPDSKPGRITLAYAESWPSTRSIENAVTIRFVAGYGAPDAVPGRLRTALMRLVQNDYDHVGAPDLHAAMKKAILDGLWDYRWA